MSYLQGRSQMNPNQPIVGRNSYDYSSNDEDEDDEEERILSDIHGEAADDNRTRGRNQASVNDDGTVNPKKRKSEDNKDIDEQYRQLAAKRRIPRPKLTAEKLTGVDGLIRIPTEFSQNLRSFVPKNRHDIAGAAAFSRALIRSYERFATDLFPSACPEDVYYKIEQLGSSKMCRDYLQHMRTQQRNTYLEKALGKERAIKIIDQFDDELRLQQQSLEEIKLKKGQGKKANSENTEEDGQDDLNEESPVVDNVNGGTPVSASAETPSRSAIDTSPTNTTPRIRTTIAITPNPYASSKKKQQNKAVDDGEYEATFNEDTDKMDDELSDSFPQSNNSRIQADLEDKSDNENEDDIDHDFSTHAPTTAHHKRRVIEESDEEESENELIVEDDDDNISMQDNTEVDNDQQRSSMVKDKKDDDKQGNDRSGVSPSFDDLSEEKNDKSGSDNICAHHSHHRDNCF